MASLRTGGREAVEDTPVTGATEEQIQAAAESLHEEWRKGGTLAQIVARAFCDLPEDEQETALRNWTQMASHLVPVGYVIVRAEDALTAEDRAAIRDGIAVIDGFDRSLEKLQDADDMFDVSTTQVDFREYRNCLTADGLARLRAIAAGGTE